MATPDGAPGGRVAPEIGWSARGAVRPYLPPGLSTDPSTPGPTPSPTPAVAAAVATAPPEATQPPTAAPTARPPAPPPPGDAGRCPIAMAADAPAGWRRVVTSTFDETTPLGAWPGPVAATAWKNRLPGPDSSGRGRYDSSRTISEHDGLLDVHVHSEGDTRYVAAPVSTLGGMHGARISICMRTDAIPGYKVAFLLWPTEGDGNSMGEIDFPEAKLDGPPTTAYGFMHYAPEPSSGKHQDWVDSGAYLQDWHVYTIEWNPKASQPYVRFLVDGRLLGESTSHVPWVPMFYVMQIETYLGGDPLPPPAEGHVQVDWVTIDQP